MNDAEAIHATITRLTADYWEKHGRHCNVVSMPLDASDTLAKAHLNWFPTTCMVVSGKWREMPLPNYAGMHVLIADKPISVGYIEFPYELNDGDKK